MIEGPAREAYSWNMARSVRHFVFLDDGSLGFLPRRVIDGLVFKRDSLPQYAGRRIRIAWALIRNKKRVPQELEATGGEIWLFDEAGRLADEDELRDIFSQVQFIETAPTDSNVVSLADRLREKRIAGRRWEPSSKEITQIVHAIWPETAGSAVKAPQRITGVLKRRPPLTREAKWAIDQCWSPMFTIRQQIEGLSEAALKAFIAQMEEEDPLDPLHSALSKGIAGVACKQLEIKQAWRSGKGKWYAVAYLYTERQGDVNRMEDIEHVECKGQAASVKAAQALIRKYAEEFTAISHVEVEIHPEVEWEPSRSSTRPIGEPS